MLTLSHVFSAVSIFLQVLDSAILLYVILSWFRPKFRAFYWLAKFIAPFVAPFRRLSMWVMTRTRIPLDLSCWFAMIAITIIERLWARLYILLITIVR
ncbi:MAG: YggT family protein [Clostridia bacterium]|nr:YggT family protein [Clostridia bacterium]